MKRLCVCVGLLVFASLLPTVASAGPITVDPIIGVRGGMFGSPGPDANFNAFGSCDPLPGAVDSAADLAAAGFSCLVVNITEGFGLSTTGLLSAILQVQTTDGVNAGDFVEDEGVFCESYYCTPRPGSDFNVTDLHMNGLVSFDGDGQALRCGESESFCQDALFYIKPGEFEAPGTAFQMAFREINGQAVTTPEPASLLLIGTGIATLAGRRLRRKNS
jgi:hypothetical protein